MLEMADGYPGLASDVVQAELLGLASDPKPLADRLAQQRILVHIRHVVPITPRFGSIHRERGERAKSTGAPWVVTPSVIPPKAGIHELGRRKLMPRYSWIPASAGMTR
jgi:hypothetical protein